MDFLDWWTSTGRNMQIAYIESNGIDPAIIDIARAAWDAVTEPPETPPPPGQNQWTVNICGCRVIVNSLSHQKAKRAAIDWLCQGCGDPESFRRSISDRVREGFKGGVYARKSYRKMKGE
jgi:hypothetical protein